MAVILRDLAAGYEHDLPVGPPYRDYISVLQDQAAAESLAYWTGYLRDIEPCRFPLLNGAVEGERELRTVEVSIQEPIIRKLQTLSQGYNITMANVFQMVWALVLRTYTSSPNVVFGYLSSGRDAPIQGIENAVGAFINMLACRVNAHNSIPVANCIQTIQDDFLKGLPHQYTSLAEIQHALHLSGDRLFNTILSLQRPMTEGIGRSRIAIHHLGGSDPR